MLDQFWVGKQIWNVGGNGVPSGPTQIRQTQQRRMDIKLWQWSLLGNQLIDVLMTKCSEILSNVVDEVVGLGGDLGED